MPNSLQVRPQTVIRRYARSDASRKARELFQNFVTAFLCLSKFTRSVHVYAKVRLPKPEIAVGEIDPVVEFLQSLHCTGCLAFESVSTATRACEDFFKRYKPVEGLQGKF